MYVGEKKAGKVIYSKGENCGIAARRKPIIMEGSRWNFNYYSRIIINTRMSS